MSDPVKNVSHSVRREPRKLERRGYEIHLSDDAAQSSDAASRPSLNTHEEYGRSHSRSDGVRNGNIDGERDHELNDYDHDITGTHALDSDRLYSDVPSEGPGNDTVHERAMRIHFMDVESSFLPEVGHALENVAETRNNQEIGADDTYLELTKPQAFHEDEDDDVSMSSQEQDHAKLMEAVDDTSTSQLEDAESFSPSPASAAAAAAFRSDARAKPLHMEYNRPPSQDTARPTSKGSTIKPMGSPDFVPEPSQSGSVKDTSVGRKRRSDMLGARQFSHHSTMSSSTMNSDISGSDTTGNVDFALQTGGATAAATPTPANGPRRARIHARMPSLGSNASYADASDNDYALPTLSRFAGTLGPFKARVGDHFSQTADERPETPRANGHSVQAPTDTVLAKRVESIQVPETIARDFRARNRSISPEKRPTSSGVLSFQDRPRRTLTLKEQNAKIDKLTKENFDLKLKIHFLDQALQSRSDDGVKDLIDKNVQLQTDLANERKEAQNMRRKIRDLERKLQEQQKASSTKPMNKVTASNEHGPTLHAEMHEEILYLRQQLDRSENQVTTLQEDLMTKDLEKRKMAEHMRSMADTRGEDTAGMDETVDMWQDLLNAETGRREQAEDDLRRLRDELAALKIERASTSTLANRDPRLTQRRSRLTSAGSTDTTVDDVANLRAAAQDSTSAFVDQLKHENAELRRDLGAQTSMLTSRNRERERLQQEIEDLKLLQRKSDGGRSVAGDSIFDRSVSRAHQRAPSRTSEQTHATMITEAEREDWDRKEGQLRDQNAELRLKFQELERTHSTHLQYVTALESDFQEMEAELDENSSDLRALQAERNEVLQAYEEKEAECSRLEQEAVAEIEKLIKELETVEARLQQADNRAQKTQTKLDHVSDGYKGLQGELREITQSVMSLEDEKQANMRSIQTLEQQLAETEEEVQSWELKSKEAEQKVRKLEITHESLHTEIAFLREEQEGDKLKIGELENGLNAAQQTVQDEQDKMHDMEASMMEERQQRDVLENKSKEEVQKVLDGLNVEAGKTKDEIRKLRRSLSSKEVELNQWKQKLDELESNLRAILGDPTGTQQSLLNDIERIQRDSEIAVNQLDRARMDMADKDRLLRHRDGLLESTSLESRRLSDLLDKERASRKRDLEQFEKSSRGQATHMRQAAQQESRILDLETAYSQDKRKMAAQEEQFREQLSDRNALLLALWNRLSTLCGTGWAQNHSLVNGELPSLDVIAKSLPGFNRNILMAITTVESLIGSFKTRIKSIEKDLSRDYQTLEHNLTLRMRRMDTLEKLARDAQRLTEEQAALQRQQASQAPVKGTKSAEEISRLTREIKLLKSELKFHRQHPSPMAQQLLHQQNQTSPDRSRRGSIGGLSITKPTTSPVRMISNLLRHHSSSAVEQLSPEVPPEPSKQHRLATAISTQEPAAPDDLDTHPTAAQALTHIPSGTTTSSAGIHPNEQRWVHRLKELERRLKAEREGRLLDRRGARQRLEEGRQENEELRQKLEREKDRRQALLPAMGAGGADDRDDGRGNVLSLKATVDGPDELVDRGRHHALSNLEREKSVD